ncbi:glycosyltransferase family 2 protein [Heliobacterium mobile]|nr:glycosyltransferase family 2 protein [Heliobacterium mobile]
MLPKVSLITAVKNRAKYIENCMRSVVEQDYPNIEHIVIDGASNDGTLEILEKYRDRIRLYSEADDGPVDAFAKAMEKVTGDIIGFVMSDERYHPGAVEWAVKAFEAHPDAAIIFGDYRVVDEHYDLMYEWKSSPISFTQLLCCEKTIPASASFIRTEALKQQGKLVDVKELIQFNEFGLWVWIAMQHEIRYVPGMVADYMLHSSSFTCTPSFYPKLLQEKEKVIRTALEDPRIPTKMRNLNDRALGGLFYWGAESVIEGAPEQGNAWFARAKRLFSSMLRDLSGAKELALFGAGTEGRIAAAFLEAENITITKIIDNNQALWGTELKGKEVKGADALSGAEFVIVACSRWYEPIARQLESLGFTETDYWRIPVQCLNVRQA